MEKIDWDKAPEGATHYMPEQTYCVACWVKVIGGHAFYSYGIKGEEWKSWGGWNDFKLHAIPRPSPAWNGEGLPPVGTVCEWKGLLGGYWVECEVVAVSKSQIVLKHAESSTYRPGEFEVFSAEPLRLEFRPIRTPEQIAADEREAAIEELRKLLSNVACDDYHAAVAMIDAGYRKQ